MSGEPEPPLFPFPCSCIRKLTIGPITVWDWLCLAHPTDPFASEHQTEGEQHG